MNKGNLRHGHTRNGHESPTYSTWNSMLRRVRGTNRSGQQYVGLTVCDRWSRFENFLLDMGERPAGTSIDRIDNNKGYFCGVCISCVASGQKPNCRWATRKQQQRNTSRNRMLTLGEATRSLAEWAELCGLAPRTLSRRLARGWSLRRAIEAAKQNPPPITPAQITAMRQARAEGSTFEEIGHRFGVSTAAAHRAARTP